MGTWYTSSSHILQPPEYHIIVNPFSYIDDQFIEIGFWYINILISH